MSVLYMKIQRQLVELNLFDSRSNDTEAIQEERWSTRFYLVLLALSITSLVIYTGFGIQTVHVTVEKTSSTSFEELQLKYPDTLKCPCSSIAVKYERFIQVQPIYHQVCSSVFITQEWISATYAANVSNIWPMDVRTVISAHAQLLRSFCKNSQRAVSFAIANILAKALVSSFALSPRLVNIQINTQKTSLISTSQSQLEVGLNSLQFIASSTHLMSGLGTNSFFYILSNSSSEANVGINVYQLNHDSAPCYCSTIDPCAMPSALYSTSQVPTFGLLNLENWSNQSIPIKGIKIGCFPVDGFLASTLECYYDPTCLELLVSNSTSFSPLSLTRKSPFPMNATIQTLVNQVMVDDWSINTSFGAYYEACAPQTCTYSYNRRNHWLIVVTTILALSGGLNTVLRLLIPIVVKLIRTKIRTFRLRNEISRYPVAVVWIERRSKRTIIKEKLTLLCDVIRMLNFFDSNLTNPVTQKRERQATRLYILSMSTVFLILLLYTVTTKETRVYNIRHPSQSTYNKLYTQYSDTFDCACSSISVPYGAFISINATYHQICSSMLISPFFFTQLAARRPGIPNYPGDFMIMSVDYFQWLFTFCELAARTVRQQLLTFNAQLLIRDKLLTRTAFDDQTTTIVTDFIGSVQFIFSRGIREIRQMMGFAQPISATSSVLYQLKIKTTPLGRQIEIQPSDFFSDCSCLCNPTGCSKDVAFYSYNLLNSSFEAAFRLPGIKIGCSPMESVLQSNLHCWFSFDCLNTVLIYWNNLTYGLTVIPPKLNSTIASRFNASTVFNDIVEQLMVENWTTSISYDSYFRSCDPQYCTYSVTQQGGVVQFITALLGIFGGLNLSLRLLIPLMVQCGSWFIAHGRNCGPALCRHLKDLPLRLIHLNLFDRAYPSSEQIIAQERQSTRFYLFLLTLSMLSVTFYYSFTNVTTTVFTVNPSLSIYESLRKSTAQSTLQCPCAHVSIPYNTFVKVNTSIHEVCSSPFIEQPWIRSIFGSGDWSNYSLNDIYGRGAAYFQGLFAFCFMYRGNMERYASFFVLTNFISSEVISETDLSDQVTDAIEQINTISKADHSALCKFSRDLINDNQLLSIYSTNWVPLPIQFDPTQIGLPIPLVPVSHGNCSCATSFDCIESVHHKGFTVPGLVVSCHPLQSLFKSTLVCLYNQSCIDQINMNNLNVTALMNPTKPGYAINRTIEQLVDTAFDEQWSFSIDYGRFFNECQPVNCHYLVTDQRNAVLLLTILLGFYGGLTVTLKAISPYLIDMMHKILVKYRIHGNRL